MRAFANAELRTRAVELKVSQQEAALLFKRLATLRTDAELFADVDALRWQGPTPAFAAWAAGRGAPQLAERALAAQALLAERG